MATRDAQRKNIQGTLDAMIEGIANAVDEAASSEAMRAYIEVGASFHGYSFHNTMLIAMQCPRASRVAGFRKWLKHGRHVIKGQKGISILVPMRGKKDPDDPDDPGRLYFGPAYVFDISQTEGDPMPPSPALADRLDGEADELLAVAIRAAERNGCTVEINPEMQAEGSIHYESGTLSLKPKKSTARMASTLMHELGHWILRCNREDRPKQLRIREMEADAVAECVCRWAGMEFNSGSYAALYGATADDVRNSLKRIKRATQTIIGFLEDEIPAAVEEGVAV